MQVRTVEYAPLKSGGSLSNMMVVKVSFGENGKQVDQVDLINMLLTQWGQFASQKPPICLEYLEECETWEEMSRLVNVLRDNEFEVISVTSGSVRPDWLRDVTYRIVLIFGNVWLKYKANEYYWFPDSLEEDLDMPEELLKPPLPSLTLHVGELDINDVLEFLKRTRYSHWRIDKTYRMPLL